MVDLADGRHAGAAFAVRAGTRLPPAGASVARYIRKVWLLDDFTLISALLKDFGTI